MKGLDYSDEKKKAILADAQKKGKTMWDPNFPNDTDEIYVWQMIDKTLTTSDDTFNSVEVNMETELNDGLMAALDDSNFFDDQNAQAIGLDGAGTTSLVQEMVGKTTGATVKVVKKAGEPRTPTPSEKLTARTVLCCTESVIVHCVPLSPSHMRIHKPIYAYIYIYICMYIYIYVHAHI